MKKNPKKWIAFDTIVSKTKNEQPTDNVGNHRHKTNIKNNFSKPNSKSKVDFNLLDKLKPQNVEDLAVHAKKIKEVSQWLEQNIISRKNIDSTFLVLSGPTGAGKTATVNALCKSLNISIKEWVNPIDQDAEGMYAQAQSSRFLEFFTQEKYISLCENFSSKRITLVEDFPNFLIHNPLQFGEILEKCLVGNLPVVFICTDASSSKIDLFQTLFTEEINNKYHITNVNFNPVSATLIKNALKHAQDIIRKQSDLFRVPSSDVVEAITISSMGDIRSAINQLVFACLKGVQDIPLELNNGMSKKRKRGKNTALKSMERDETLGFFHALGRVLNPKRDEASTVWKLQCDFDSLIDQFSTQPSNFNAFLQENYLKYFGDLNDVQKAADVLSESQLFLMNWTERHEILMYALWVAVLGLMIFNEHKVSKWNQIKGPTKLKQINNSTKEICDLRKTDYCYYNIITKTNKFHVFK